MSLLPLFPGVPGGPELLVVLLLLVALFGVPLVVAFLGWQYLRGDSQVEELEARVRELESELETGSDETRERTADGSPATNDDTDEAGSRD
jgi:sec-independent protein translocase protein TatA